MFLSCISDPVVLLHGRSEIDPCQIIIVIKVANVNKTINKKSSVCC